MDYAARVRCPESERNLPRDSDRFVDRQWRTRIKQPLQRLALDRIHADQPAPAVLGEVVDTHDVRA